MFETRPLFAITLAGALVLAACASDPSPAPAEERSAEQTQPPASPKAANVQVPAPAPGEAWTDWATRRATEVRSARPELAADIDALAPAPGRDGQQRFRGPWMSDPDVAPLLLSASTRPRVPL